MSSSPTNNRFVQTGILLADQPAGEIGPHLAARNFAETPLGKAAGMKLDGLRTRFMLPHCSIADSDFDLTLSYESQKLDRLELFLHLPNDGKTWADWSLEKEKLRKKTAESWAAKLLGRDLALKPYELDGQLITPFEPTWDLPRHAPCPWGELISFHDSKAGFSGLLIQYRS